MGTKTLTAIFEMAKPSLQKCVKESLTLSWANKLGRFSNIQNEDWKYDHH